MGYKGLYWSYRKSIITIKIKELIPTHCLWIYLSIEGPISG